MIFPNLTIIPSYMGSRVMGISQGAGTFDSHQLLMGEVKGAVYPSDPKSLTKKYLEYVVDVDYRQGSGPTTSVRFQHCLVINKFGGIADKSEYTLRADPSIDEKNVWTTGSKVLLLCLNGETSRAYIIGGIRTDNDGDSKEAGHHWKETFNGAEFGVNKDGEISVTFNGATKADGTLADGVDPKASGTKALFSKDGSASLSTAAGQSITIDNANKKITINADSKWEVNVKGDANITTSGNVTIKTTGKVEINAAYEISLTASAPINIISSSSISLQSTLVNVSGNLTVAGALTSSSLATGPLTFTGAAVGSGSLSVSGEVTSGGISLSHHVHTDPQGGTTGPPI